MKRLLVFAVMFALFSAPAFAARNSQTMTVPVAIKAGSTELTPGDYNVTWTGSGSNVQVTFARNRKVIVTLPAKEVDQTNKNEGFDTSNQGGVEILQSIRMKNMSLVLESSTASDK
jgi:opacity protein-like surface antigen